ncbi:efflux RND transporter periplasmic adaptor subunit [Cohaesibacter celericrescens]|nr:efflux RND transporter periplasmic adaptor subunit [Cohaesibacter celericrescens]
MNEVSKIEVDIEIDDLMSAEPQKAQSTKRAPLFLGLLAAVAVIGGGVYAYQTLYASKHVVTDNAYVGADIANITAMISAPVAEVMVADAQHVKKGDILARLDSTDTDLQFAQAEAGYQQALRQVKSIAANNRTLHAQIEARKADIQRAEAQVLTAQANLDKAQIDFDRRASLAKGGSVSGDELTAAEAALKIQKANLTSAQASLAAAKAALDAGISAQEANAAMIEGVAQDKNPQVLVAKAMRDQARVNQERTIIRAPVEGVVSKRNVQVGERVQPGMRLMVVVPLQDVFVDANYKEVQLANVKPGQRVTLHSDLYGSGVSYDGTVTGFTGGTGSAFSVIPAQNATGNWIKVVQRLPVRIALDPAQLETHPLEVGLSMTADIHVAE